MDDHAPPPTDEGWFALHDFRRVDWDHWHITSQADRDTAIDEGRSYLESVEAVDDADDGASVTYAVNGHKADILVIHLRPTLDALNRLERRFERTALARFLDRPTSYVSVTEVSGYSESARGYFEDGELDDTGLENYIKTRLYPTIPDAEYVCFYPMSKRRTAENNWYDLSFADRAEHMEAHGTIGRQYGGQVTQMITGSIGLDDWEWGVTLWGNDPVVFKDLLYEMRFDPSTSKFAEFGGFYTGERLSPNQLSPFFAGTALAETDASAESAAVSPHGSSHDGGSGHHEHAGDTATAHAGGPSTGGDPEEGGADIRDELADLGVYAGQPHGEDVYALVLYSDAPAGEVSEEVDGLRENFEHYDTHVKTAVYRVREGEQTAVVSIWETDRAAQTAAGFLSELPGVTGRVDDEDGFSTLGMFYTVTPEYVDEFTSKFSDVKALLADMDGHRDTQLFVNDEAANDMFIASHWGSQDDAMAFFRSDAFRDTVDWGREVLADRPRHVFLA